MSVTPKERPDRKSCRCSISGLWGICRAGPGVEGLLHITQLSKSPVQKTEDVVQVGERHLLRVLTVNPERQRIRLSLKSVSTNEQIEWMTNQPATPPPAPSKPERRERKPKKEKKAEAVATPSVTNEEDPTSGVEEKNVIAQTKIK